MNNKAYANMNKKKYITKKGRWVEFQNVWLLYNFYRYTGFFWTQKDAWREAYESNFNKEDTKELYQVLRGNIKITIHQDPFYKKPIKKKKRKEKTYHCDNCGKIIDCDKGAFQCGVNKKKKTGTWCSKKCFKQHRKSGLN